MSMHSKLDNYDERNITQVEKTVETSLIFNWYLLESTGIPVDRTGICASLFYWLQLVNFTCTSISQLKPIDLTGTC